jgi:acetamidase/formamidase
LETRDALDGQLKADATVADLAAADANLIHPLTGPVFIKGARPGDMVEIEFIDIVPEPTAFSAIVPGLGCRARSRGRAMIGQKSVADGQRIRSTGQPRACAVALAVAGFAGLGGAIAWPRAQPGTRRS